MSFIIDLSCLCFEFSSFPFYSCYSFNIGLSSRTKLLLSNFLIYVADDTSFIHFLYQTLFFFFSNTPKHINQNRHKCILKTKTNYSICTAGRSRTDHGIAEEFWTVIHVIGDTNQHYLKSKSAAASCVIYPLCVKVSLTLTPPLEFKNTSIKPVKSATDLRLVIVGYFVVIDGLMVFI